MRNISIFLFVFVIAVIKAQVVSDYRYVVIPAEFNDFKENRTYGLSNQLEKTLKAKKYTVLPATKNDWPSDALMNPCSILNAELLDDKSMFRNKLILQFKDCSNKIVFTEKGSSTIKEFEPGYQDALKQILTKIPASNPTVTVNKLAETTASEPVKKELQGSKETILQTSNAVRYSNGTLALQKIQIDNSQFILVDSNSSVPFATFKSTAKKDVYRVKLGSGESTIGYYENGNIVIEMPKSNGEFANEIFTAN
ncbi:hypothetical protein [Epilithonimonas arachidiradicis]|uniref:Uncharacterized protein n=1 Tax=Epilithonimonas arachidiradicis TaxID=1617282 RepID=A0A420D8B3_9FLAO|nr:hypothetical protein [Epilithonimonas arachidiradicis]RKE86911.1 hypothetical protein BXY58_2326 [Epilithonimonas arachidiradicis]GGG61110.1 hypothetical protein GCM10007332_23720 [Epilithonimonas arachidiradicis]